MVPPPGSDVVLVLLTLNVLASGTYDLLSGNQVILHPRDVGIPFTCACT
jgi:hypothetical protein